MKCIIVQSFLLVSSLLVQAQLLPAISVSEVSRIENTLASDDMQGRKVFTPGIDSAASFIAKEFKQAGLRPLKGNADFYQHFGLPETEITGSMITLDGIPVEKNKIVIRSLDSSIEISEGSQYQKIIVKNSADLNGPFFKNWEVKKNVLILVDTSLYLNFVKMANRQSPLFEGRGNRIYILTSSNPVHFNIRIKQKVKLRRLSNIIGILPGSAIPGEYLIFSAHYDHLGVGKPDAQGDSIYNGANDDASGTTAVIALAKYFSLRHQNSRTIIFVTFTGEESGLLGSKYFSGIIDPDKVIAMINIEMIGTESKWGKNSAYITGYEKSDLGAILQKNLVKTPFTFYPDPYPEQGLFLRSDNASLAKLGVPAHTISTSKMNEEKNYHQRSDETGTLDLNNMTEIIRSIAIGAGSIIEGKDTASRVNTQN